MAEPLKTEEVREDLRLVRSTLDEGVYVIERGHAAGTYLTIFRVKPRGPVLALPAGTYAEGSPEYTAARDGLVAWCATPGRRDRASCAAATSLFDTVSQDTACAGRLELSATTGPGRLVSGSCRPHVVATYSREDDGWYVDDVGVRPAEVRPEEGEDPNRDAREKAMDELRRGAAMKEPSELDPDDGVGAW